MLAETLVTSYVIEDNNGDFIGVEKSYQQPIYIYVLLLNNSPIYVGKTNNLKNRISNHSKKILFDNYLVIGHYYSEDQAMIAERSAISSLSIFTKLLNKNTLGYSKLFNKQGQEI